LDDDNDLLSGYVWGLDLSGSPQGAGGVGGLVLFKNNTQTPTYHFPAYDGNGNVVALVAASDGNATAQYEFSPFGETLSATGGQAAYNPFRFSSKYTDDETGLLYYGYRYYNPSTGRWPSRDPMGEYGGLNLYGYVFNSPVNWIDPLGLGNFPVPRSTTCAEPNPSNPRPKQRWGPGQMPEDQVFRAIESLKEQRTLQKITGIGPARGGPPVRAAETGQVSPPLQTLATQPNSGIVQNTPPRIQLEFPFARGASVQTPGITTAGETFVRVGASFKELNFSFNGPGGTLPRTYAMPVTTFDAIGRDPAVLQSLLDMPGSAPLYYRYLQPPPGTLIQRGIVPGGEFGGVGGVPEVRFPNGF